MVKTLDRMVSETLTEEVKKIKEQQVEVAKLKLQTVTEMKEAAKKFNKFTTRALAEELAQFAQERNKNKSHSEKLETFIMTALAEEINEFAQDKQALTETRVKLIAEAKNQLNELKKKFVERSSKAVSEIVAQTLNHEITQLHEDIKIARQNNFGKKIFEAFKNEFTGVYVSENQEYKELENKLQEVTNQLTEAKKEVKQKTQLVESTNRNLSKAKNSANREKIITEMLNPLEKSKREVMSQLLENVQTQQLRVAFDKYLPSVLNNRQVISRKQEILNESTGDKHTRVLVETDSLNDIKRLAGLQQ
jgi:DNA repair exonuclease SbcCD ATPase subunit